MHPILRAGIAGFRQNLLPGVVIWSVALAIVLAFYLAPSLRPSYAAVAAWKQAYGFAFSGAATAVFGALLPFVALCMLRRVPAGRRSAVLAFLLAHWIYRGIEVDAFYRLQAMLFGDGADPATLAKKVALDQLVYSACWTGWTSMIAYRWKDCGFSWTRTRRTIDRAFWRHEVPTAVVSMWGVWIPAVTIIYALPQPLQVPLFNVVLCFWVILLETVARRAEPAALPAQAAA